MVQRINRYGAPATAVSTSKSICSLCGVESDWLLQIDISNGYALIYSGSFCNWNEYSAWKEVFDEDRKSKLIAQEGMG